MKIGVIAIQGAVSEHVDALRRALKERGVEAEVVEIKHKGIVPECSGIVIPGGESTTLCRLLAREGIAEEIKEAAAKGVPILGTCAGLIVIAKEGDRQVEKTGQELLGIMDTRVNRNAFGRQRDSFEAELELSILDSPFTGVFIRAPGIVSCGPGVKVLSRLEGMIIAAEQGNLLALAFHPELTDDLRIHQYFLDKVFN
ncbi:pyridoxal 5'-phosphate synthase glutaminase subunit PdxT [Methanosarcina mazei]|nr:pyridoxal 5'-phosphate synthase glutaminase subunit PdxT [Methanosarcina mazei]AKB41094.1 Pyridoxine biosynthesis glutamine amidotransferase, glutaminase subunit [Methanosarcina mazei WWM610]AKB72075.1 Pyridoxine biosynthesis glutamine amidotransferase, glutaminase subunit [Methanosarcina mazei C16]KKG02266.1 glutamine amidotransferase [Methanosarcina mazei]KKG02833.1 glutamine amidotransferase [Methanosarcina mazei]KKG06661.1 glutamine amidotransferase [Methanosarcina mazei]